MATNWTAQLQRGAGGEGAKEFVFKVPRHNADLPALQESISLQAFVGEASESFDDTGTVLWPAAPLLCYFLLSDVGQRLLQGTSVNNSIQN